MKSNNASATLLGLVDCLYDAIANPARLDDFLGQTADAVSAKSGLLRVKDAAMTRVLYGRTHNLDEGLQRAYADHFIRVDPYVEVLKVLPKGVVYPGEHAVPAHELAKTEFFNDYMRPMNNAFVAGGVALGGDRLALQFALQRDARGGAFDKGDIAFLQALMPHLQRLLDIQAIHDLQAKRAMAADHVVESFEAAMILLDQDRVMVHANAVAETLLRRGAGLTVVGRRVTAVDDQDAQGLRALVANACNPAVRTAEAVGSMLIRASEDGERNLLVVIHPLRGENTGSLFAANPEAAAVLYCVSPAQGHGIKRQMLRTLFGLTPAEARLALELTRSADLQQAAEQLNLSANTVKSQLRAVFRKTNTRRQQELVRLLSDRRWALVG